METLIELQALLAEYWAVVDRAPATEHSAASFYVDTGEMILGSLHIAGRANIEAFFSVRNEKEIANRRSTRHFTANLRLRELSVDRIVVHALVIAYSGVGNWPLSSEAPSAVGDFEFHCVRAQQAGWRFEKVKGTSVFVGAGAAAFAKG
jgi:hypothetical protein